MNVNVSQIGEYDGLTIQHVYAQGEPRLRSDDSRIVGQPSLRLHMTRDGVKVRLVGTLNASVQLDCDRCLAPVEVQVDQKFDLLYVPPLGVDEERELADQDLGVGFYHAQVIDLDDVVREQIELALPMGRLCTQACRGLCQECGANLNELQCSCAAEDTDPRWAALNRLKAD